MATDQYNVDNDTQFRVRRFFELYDPERLETSDFNVLLRYISSRGLPALEDKLMKKYGSNISMMENERNRYSSAVGNPQTLRAVDQPNEQPMMAEPTQNDNVQEGEKELSELDNLPPPPENAQEEVAFRRREIPSVMIPDTAIFSPEQSNENERQQIFERLTNFYRTHNQERLLQGIGGVVDFALKKGIDKINKKLMDTYGEDLDGFERRMQKSRHESTKMEMTQMKQEEARVGKMDPEWQQLRKELIDFFLAVEPQRAEIPMDPLIEYAKKNGQNKLNEKLFKKYGSNLIQKPNSMHQHAVPPRASVERPSSARQSHQKRFDPELKTLKKGDLPEYVRSMLSKYYGKYDRAMLKENGVDAVYEWTKRNGLAKLNRKLAERYGQSLQEFISMANDLRDDLIDFYRHTDKNRLVTGIQSVLDWGLFNGRNALNEKLRAKYGINLDQSDIYADHLESASQF